jgi:glucose-1-phosphate thymidylyltransferase
MDLEIIGLIPAGGKGSRIAPIPCSKEVFPIGFYESNNNNGPRPKVVSHYLLENLKEANIKNAMFVIKKGKWDIPSYFGDGSVIDMNLAYVTANEPYGHPFTIQKAFPFVKDKIIAFGYPDIMIKPKTAYSQLVNHLQSNPQTDVVLGLFPVADTEKWDMVELSENKVTNIQLKPTGKGLEYTWTIAIWKPSFTAFMSDCLEKISKEYKTHPKKNQEVILDHLFIEAIKKDMQIEGVRFKEGECLDIGTPEDLKKAIIRNSNQ